MKTLKIISLLSILAFNTVALACIKLEGPYQFHNFKVSQVREDQHIRMHVKGSKERIEKLKELNYQCRRVTNRDARCHKFLTDSQLPPVIADQVLQKYQSTNIFFHKPTQANELIYETPFYKSVKVNAKTNYTHKLLDYYLFNTTRNSSKKFHKLVFYNEGDSKPQLELVYSCDRVSRYVSKRKHIAKDITRSYQIEILYR